MKTESFFAEFFSTGFSLCIYIGIPFAITYGLHLFMGLPFIILSTLISITVTYFFGYLTSLLIYKVLNIDIEKIAKQKMKDKMPGGPGGSSSQAKKEADDNIDINNLPPVEEKEEEEYSAGISEDAKDPENKDGK